MKIIKKSNVVHENKEFKIFTCPTCNCVFQAFKGEDYTIEQFINDNIGGYVDHWYHVTCPYCFEHLRFYNIKEN